MKVVFVQDNGINESLVLCEVSSCVQAHGHSTALVIEREVRDLRAAIADENPDLLFIPTQIRGHHWVLDLCPKLERWFPEVPRVLAGSHVTFFPDILEFPGVQMVIVGEAEYATVDLLDALAGKRPMETIDNLHLRKGKTTIKNDIRPLVEDLDSLPMPDRALYFDRYPFLARFPWKKFSSGRGCYHHCSYCYQPLYRAMCKGKGTYVRRKSPERVSDEVRQVADRWPLTNAHFSDDLFITGLSWTRELAEVYPDRAGVPFSVNSSAEFVTEETTRLLAQSGCRVVAIGIETAQEELRREILNKDIDYDVIRRAAELIRRHRMTLVTFNMLASPGETVDHGLDTLRLNADIGCDYARVGIAFPIPGTHMADEAVADGVCLPGFGRDIYERPDSGMNQHKVFFTTAEPQRDQHINLLWLFNLGVTFPVLIPLIERAVRLPKNPLFALVGLASLLKEKQVFKFSLLDGIDYFRHVGNPAERTANFVSLV